MAIIGIAQVQMVFHFPTPGDISKLGMVYNLPQFSVVIPTCNRTDELIRNLNALQHQNINPDFFEIVVSDDNSSDLIKKIVESRGSRVTRVRGPMKGRAANRNNGAKAARGSWLLFLDDDCIPDENWIVAYSKAIQEFPDVRVFEGKICADRPKQRYDESAPLNLKGGLLWSANFAIHKNLFSEINGFNEDFKEYGHEDDELRLRLLKRPEQIVFLPDALVIHPWRRVQNYFGEIKVWKSVLILLKHHPERWVHWRFWPRFRVFGGGIIRGLRDLYRYRGKGFVYFLARTCINLTSSIYFEIKYWQIRLS